MSLLLVISGLVLALLAIPALARAVAMAEQDRKGRALFEGVRFLLAVAAAAALFLIARGRPA